MAHFKVGDEVKISTIVTPEHVTNFGAVSGDRNPVHLDEAFAQRTRFGRTIAYGMLVVLWISAAIGT